MLRITPTKPHRAIIIAFALVAACKGSSPDSTNQKTGTSTTAAHTKNNSYSANKAAPSKVAPDLVVPTDAHELRSKARYVQRLKPKTGARSAIVGDVVRVRYTALEADHHKGPTELSFAVRKKEAGWRQVVADMAEGEGRRVWLANTAAGGPSVFDVELLAIALRPEKPPYLEPPAIATTTASGLRKVVLQEGDGLMPEAFDVVSVDFSGWTRDGKLFETSRTRGAPLTAAISRTIPGWREALIGMQVGERSLIWIPEELAYPDDHTRPRGTLLFDLHLKSVSSL